jgi:hypothetical protein
MGSQLTPVLFAHLCAPQSSFAGSKVGLNKAASRAAPVRVSELGRGGCLQAVDRSAHAEGRSVLPVGCVTSSEAEQQCIDGYCLLQLLPFNVLARPIEF